MFSGIIEETALVLEVSPQTGGLRLQLALPVQWNDFWRGESIAVDGVCLTLESWSDTALDFFVGTETLAVTNFASLRENDLVNLERSLKLGDRINGHLVSGHVDATAHVIKREEQGECLFLEVGFSKKFLPWLHSKCSVCLNGVSLTVNSIDKEKPSLSVLLIPETLRRTNLKNVTEGSQINIEFDQALKAIAEQIQNYFAEKGVTV